MKKRSSLLGILLVLAICSVGGYFGSRAQADVAINYTSGVHTLQVTIGSGTTQISTTSVPVKQLFIQDNAAHSIRVGDSNTSSSRGALLTGSGSPPGGSITSGAFGMQQATDLNQWFINGTQNDVIDVIFIQ